MALVQLLLLKPFAVDALLKLNPQWLLHAQPVAMWVQELGGQRFTLLAPVLAWTSFLMGLSLPATMASPRLRHTVGLPTLITCASLSKLAFGQDGFYLLIPGALIMFQDSSRLAAALPLGRWLGRGRPAAAKQRDMEARLARAGSTSGERGLGVGAGAGGALMQRVGSNARPSFDAAEARARARALAGAPHAPPAPAPRARAPSTTSPAAARPSLCCPALTPPRPQAHPAAAQPHSSHHTAQSNGRT